MGLLALALLGLLTVIVSGMGLSARSQEITVATELAREEMEAIKERGYSWPPAGTSRFRGARNDAPVRGYPPSPYPKAKREGREYVLDVTSEPVNDKVRSVIVEVRWGERGRVKLETYLHP